MINKYKNTVIWCVIAACILMFSLSLNGLDLTQFGYSKTQYNILYRFFYAFLHTNFIHIAINIYSFYLIAYKLLKTKAEVITFFLSFFINIIATFGTELPIATIGLSGIVFFLWGIIIVSHFNIRLLIITAIVLTLNIICYFFNISANIKLHIFSFFLGTITYLIICLITKSKIKNGV